MPGKRQVVDSRCLKYSNLAHNRKKNQFCLITSTLKTPVPGFMPSLGTSHLEKVMIASEVWASDLKQAKAGGFSNKNN